MVIHGNPLGFNLLVSTDAIKVLGGMSISWFSGVKFLSKKVCMCVSGMLHRSTSNKTSGLYHGNEWMDDKATAKLQNYTVEYPMSS